MLANSTPATTFRATTENNNKPPPARIHPQRSPLPLPFPVEANPHLVLANAETLLFRVTKNEKLFSDQNFNPLFFFVDDRPLCRAREKGSGVSGPLMKCGGRWCASLRKRSPRNVHRAWFLMKTQRSLDNTEKFRAKTGRSNFSCFDSKRKRKDINSYPVCCDITRAVWIKHQFRIAGKKRMPKAQYPANVSSVLIQVLASENG